MYNPLLYLIGFFFEIIELNIKLIIKFFIKTSDTVSLTKN
ncbi:hypothetical protein LCGC14_0818900 [marine sediment metagenome]|uniref:Uncharacterized protein n=1 Tax=marine sediment metagenome TaxID=412755 RepID=A0A0F9S4H8_9ZZZZ